MIQARCDRCFNTDVTALFVVSAQLLVFGTPNKYIQAAMSGTQRTIHYCEDCYKLYIKFGDTHPEREHTFDRT